MIHIEVRSLDPVDAEAYRRLRLGALQSEPFAYGSDAEEYEGTTVQQEADRIENLDAQGFILGCLDRGSLIGIVSFHREPGRKENHKGHIHGVYVSSAYRGKGIGQTLLSTMINKASADPSLEQITLAVGARQVAAQQLYIRLGFKVFWDRAARREDWCDLQRRTSHGADAARSHSPKHLQSGLKDWPQQNLCAEEHLLPSDSERA